MTYAHSFEREVDRHGVSGRHLLGLGGSQPPASSSSRTSMTGRLMRSNRARAVLRCRSVPESEELLALMPQSTVAAWGSKSGRKTAV